MPDRKAIRENAIYLRNVRPIDPEEIHEYVEDQPHPAVVRQVLREEAGDLGLVEREDGTFVPAPDDPAPVPDLPVEQFPESYARKLEDLLVESFGPGWPEGESGDDLREAIRRLKDAYYRQWDVEYDDLAAMGYAIYHLPDYYAAIQYVLADLAETGRLSRNLRVLDVGAGTGGPALGLHDALPEDALVRYDAIEPGPAADLLESMLEETGSNFHPTVHRTTAEAFDPGEGDPGEYDLVLFANVLSELDDPVAVARRYADAVADGGSLLLLSPADRNTARTLREVERALADGPREREGDGERDGNGERDGDDDASETANGATARDVTVYSPTVRLWPGEAPTDEGWSFAVRPDLEVPPFQQRLEDAAGGSNHDPGEFVNVDVQYAYAILRPDGARRVDVDPDPAGWAKMAEMDQHVSKRIDCMGIKLSGNLAEGGNPLFRVGDGSEREDHFAVLTRETVLNSDLAEAEYGDLLTFQSVLALWNDDEYAFNLVVDDETVVDRARPPI